MLSSSSLLWRLFSGSQETANVRGRGGPGNPRIASFIPAVSLLLVSAGVFKVKALVLRKCVAQHLVSIPSKGEPGNSRKTKLLLSLLLPAVPSVL